MPEHEPMHALYCAVCAIRCAWAAAIRALHRAKQAPMLSDDMQYSSSKSAQRSPDDRSSSSAVLVAD